MKRSKYTDEQILAIVNGASSAPCRLICYLTGIRRGGDSALAGGRADRDRTHRSGE